MIFFFFHTDKVAHIFGPIHTRWCSHVDNKFSALNWFTGTGIQCVTQFAQWSTNHDRYRSTYNFTLSWNRKSRYSTKLTFTSGDPIFSVSRETICPATRIDKSRIIRLARLQVADCRFRLLKPNGHGRDAIISGRKSRYRSLSRRSGGETNLILLSVTSKSSTISTTLPPKTPENSGYWFALAL